MEIIEEDDEEVKRLMLRISRKEITLCDSCDAFFDYIPQKISCDECNKKKQRERAREYYHRPEVKAKMREYRQRPEYKAKMREYQREYAKLPKERERRREYQRERYHRLKKLREEE